MIMLLPAASMIAMRILKKVYISIAYCSTSPVLTTQIALPNSMDVQHNYLFSRSLSPNFIPSLIASPVIVQFPLKWSSSQCN